MTTSWEIASSPTPQAARLLLANLIKRAVRSQAPVTVTAVGAGGAYRLYADTDQDVPGVAGALRLGQFHTTRCEYTEEFGTFGRQLTRTLVPLPLGGRHGNGQPALLTPLTQNSVAAYPHYVKGSVSLLGGNSAMAKAATAVGSVLTGIGLSLLEPRVWAPLTRPLLPREATAAGCTIDCLKRAGFVRITARGYLPKDADATYAGIMFDLCARSHPDLVTDREQLQVVRRVKQRQAIAILTVEMSDCDVLESAFLADTTYDWSAGMSPLDAELDECDMDARQVVTNYKYYATEEETTLLLQQVFAPITA